MIGAEANRRNGWCESEEDGKRVQGVGCRVQGERSLQISESVATRTANSFTVYGVRRIRSQKQGIGSFSLIGRVQLRAEQPAPLSFGDTSKGARCPNSPLRFRDFRFGISMFTAPPDTQSSVETACERLRIGGPF